MTWCSAKVDARRSELIDTGCHHRADVPEHPRSGEPDHSPTYAYGLVAADLTAQQSTIDAYTATVGSPRAAATVRKGATAEIEALVKDSMKILNNRMDKLMPEFEASNAD